MRHVLFFLTILAVSSSWPALASEHDYEDGEYGENSSAKFYGTVDALPQNVNNGTWLVNGRQVVVNPGTEVKEKRGKAAVGAYVKVEGHPTGSSFTADEIEVKGRRH
ncbi:DUF5666 domain-containing protein [Candidatus Electronema sp. PJ]|uniref:DUF5666 domain-containing protein n=1 Tax=Candidatus Electronema sp. PJ TaxID=3401572 RepID=UPI003AA9CB50